MIPYSHLKRSICLSNITSQLPNLFLIKSVSYANNKKNLKTPRSETLNVIICYQ